MAGPDDTRRARQAQQAVLTALNRPAWLTGGVGIGCAGRWREAKGWGGEAIGAPLPCTPAVIVGVLAQEHVALARSVVGDSVYGVPVVFQVVGRIVAQTGMESQDEAVARAREAKDVVRATLNRPAWGRGVGLGCVAKLGETWVHAGPDAPCQPAVYVMVQRPEHVPLARAVVGQSVYGIPVVIEAVGDFELAGSDARPPPTSPPPFGKPEGHIGGSYAWWWWNFGRPAGMPYEPREGEP